MHNDVRSTTAPNRRRAPSAYAWTGGAVLILLGAIFLLHNAGVIAVGNWWAVFMLIPAMVTAGTAWAQYRTSGRRLTPAVSGSLIGSVVLATVAAIFLLGLPWGTIWPVFLIIAGLAALLQWASGSWGGESRMSGQ